MSILAQAILDTLFHYEKKYHNTKDKNIIIELDSMLLLISKLINNNILSDKKEIGTITYKINKFISFVKRGV